MKLSSPTYPIDILLCLAVSVLVVPIVLLSMDSTVRTILGLPFLLFIPGYVLVGALFPGKKTDRGIDTLERLALSFGLSIALIPLIGLLLNYTLWGIRLEPILFSLFLFIMGGGFVAMYRWYQTSPDERFIVSFSVTFSRSTSKVDLFLTVVLLVCIIVAFLALIYVVMLPKTGEAFTEFYLLGPTGKATGYPRDLTVGENATVRIGLANHEYRTINYTIEVWLVNQTIVFNTTTRQNDTLTHHLWYVDTITTTLNHTAVDTEQPWTVQWEQNYSFAINKTGQYKLAFLLFTSSTEEYERGREYADIASQKFDSAYRELHLWLSVE